MLTLHFSRFELELIYWMRVCVPNGNRHVVYGAADDNDIIVTPKFIYAKCQTMETNHNLYVCLFASVRQHLYGMVQQHGTHYVIVYRILLLLLFLFSVGGGDDDDRDDDDDVYARVYMCVWLFDVLHHHH